MKKNLLVFAIVVSLLCNFIIPVRAEENKSISGDILNDTCSSISSIGWIKNQADAANSSIVDNGEQEYVLQGLKGEAYSNIYKAVEIGCIPWNFDLNLKITDLQTPKANNQWRGFTIQIVNNGQMVRMSLNSLENGRAKAYVLSSSAANGYIEKDISIPEDTAYHHWNIYNDGSSNVYLSLDDKIIAVFNNVNYSAKNVDDSILLGNDMHDNASGNNNLSINHIELSKVGYLGEVQVDPVSEKGVVTIVSSYGSSSTTGNVMVSGLLYENNVLLSQNRIYIGNSKNFSLDFRNVNKYGDLKLVLNLYMDNKIVDTIERTITVNNNEIANSDSTINAGNVSSGEEHTYIFNDFSKINADNPNWHINTYSLSGTSKTLKSISYAGSDQANITIPIKLNGSFAIYIGHSTDTDKVRIQKGSSIKDVEFKSVINGNQNYNNDSSVFKESFLLGGSFNNETIKISVLDYHTEIFYIKIKELSDADKTLFTTKGDGKNLMFDDDGYSNFYSNLYNSYDFLQNKYMDSVTDANVGTVNWCLGTTGLINYDSAYAGSPYSKIERYKDQLRPGDITALNNIKNIIDTSGKAPIQIIAEAGDKNGVNVNASLRMDSFFDPNTEGILNGSMYDSFEDCLQSDKRYLSYAYPKFRQYIINILKEAASFNGVDGVTLDYCRYPTVIGNECITSEKIEIMNQFMRDVKNALPATTKIYVRIPCDSALDYGLDAATWVKEGLIDVLIPSNIDYEKNYDITPFINMVKGTNVKVYAGITSNTKNYVPTDEEKMLIDKGILVPRKDELVYQQYLLKAADAYSKGADGIFLFNTSKYDVNNNFAIISNKIDTLIWEKFKFQNELISYSINKVEEDGYKLLPRKTSVPNNKVWTIKFNNPLKPETVNKDNVQVKTTSGSIVNVKITYNSTNNSIVIAPPDNNYSQYQSYSIYVSDKILSDKGSPLSHPVKMDFTVAP